MSCRKAYELDLASFLGDPTGATWAEFRDHYPRCAECAAEVRAWTELQLALGRDAHPDPEDLVRYVDEPARLAPRARHAIADHLAACAACRDEAHTLRTFDPLVAPAAARTPVRTPVSERPSPLRALGRLVWNPAFAYGVALLVGLYPLLSGRIATPPLKPAAIPPPTVAQSVASEREEAKEQDRLGASAPKGDEASQHQGLAKRSSPDESDTGASRRATAPIGSADEREKLEGFAERQYLADREPLARRKAAEPPAEGRLANSPRATTAAPASPPPHAQSAARADAQDKDAPAGSRDVAAAANKTRQVVAPVTVASSGETTIRIPADATAVALRFEPVPAGADAIRLAATDPHRLLGERPLDGPIARVPAEWLTPGRYVVMLYVGDRIASTARLTVTSP
jgi:hypothetical protein